MALKGTLADIGIIDLMQFPYTGRRTGELVVTADGKEGRIYYDQGSLVHACLGNAAGMEALVLMVDWIEGSFEFITDSEPPHKTVEMDLHRAVMQALKLHDERKKEEERLKLEKSAGTEPDDGILSSQLKEFVSSTDFALHASVISSDGSLRAAAEDPNGLPEGTETLRNSLHSLWQSYPRGNLNKIFLVDEQGTVVLMRLPDVGGLVVVAQKEASLGAISMSVARLAEKLE
jgi:predicted regulator of Ras-like GTPase activity (Roadblock/LC7/MglB family)